MIIIINLKATKPKEKPVTLAKQKQASKPPIPNLTQ